MPNYITTVCRVTGPEEKVAAFVDAHIRPVPEKPGDVFFDFKTVVPKPACVDAAEESSTGDEGVFALSGITLTKFAAFSDLAARYFTNRQREGFVVNQLTQPEHLREWLAEKHPEVLVAGQKRLDCFRETGCWSWYDWNIKHWGTKWGAYDYEPRSREPGAFVFKFETAWSVPTPILAKLAELYPELKIETKSIDEGGGAYAGTGGDVSCVEETRELHREVYGHTERINP